MTQISLNEMQEQWLKHFARVDEYLERDLDNAVDNEVPYEVHSLLRSLQQHNVATCASMMLYHSGIGNKITVAQYRDHVANCFAELNS